MTAISYSNKLKTMMLGFTGSVMLLALLAIGVYANDIISADRASSWPTSEGTVIYSEATRGCGNGLAFWPKVRYQYAVAGQDYTSDNLVFGNIGCGPETDAVTIARQFPLHANVTVHFNPDNPQEAVLVAGKVLEDTWVGIDVFASLLAFCLLFGYFVVRKNKPQDRCPDPLLNPAVDS